MSLEGLKETARPGGCLICDKPIPRKRHRSRSKRVKFPRPRKTCGNAECKRAHTDLLSRELKASKQFFRSVVAKIARLEILAAKAVERANKRLERAK